jgi:diguanylate cyclase (GGDEF)-like protein/PAS domain S-box-containing protein
MSEVASVPEHRVDLPSERTKGASSTRWHWLYLLANIPLVVAIFADPRYHTYLWGSLGLGSTVAIVVGVSKNRPARRAPWVLVAIAQLAFISGGITYDVLTKFPHENTRFPSFADAVHLTTYPLLAIGLFLLVRAQSRERNVGALLDSLIVTVGLALLSWIYLIEPYVRAPQLTFLTKAVSMAYPLGDILILYVIARLLLGGRRRNDSVMLLSAGGIGFLVSDSIYRWSHLHGNLSVGGPTALGFVAFFVLGGTAALHPSMREPTEKQPIRPLSPISLAAISVSTLVAPALLVARSILNPTVEDGALIGTVSALLFILVLLRITGLAQSRASLAQREHILRDLGERLLGTTELSEVVSVSLGAVAAILGDGPGTCLLTQLGDLGERVVGGIPAILVGCSVVLKQSDHAHGGLKVTFPKMPLPVVDSTHDWTQIALADVQGVRRQILISHKTDLSQDTLTILQAMAAPVSLALERMELSKILYERRSEAKFRSLVQNASDVILIVQADGRLSAETPSVFTVLGYVRETIETKTMSDLLHPDDAKAALALVESMMSGRHVGGTRAEWRVRHADGRWLVMEVTGSDLSADVNIAGVVLTLRDVTERRGLESELRHRAFHDGLTNLANRDLFNDRVGHALGRRERQATSVAVLLLDLDDFKLVNDTFGHGAGDELLIQVARRLAGLMRHGDTAARLGGDEFAICMEFDGSETDAVAALAERVLNVFGAPFAVANTDMHASATLGIASTRSNSGSNATDLLREADLALYAAKNAGKRTFRFYEPSLQQAVLMRVQERTELEHAVTHGELLVYYQPIVELHDGRIDGVEALVRWNHPERGILLPSEFIPIAEESGLIVPLGRWVLDQACADLSRWRRGNPSAHQLRMSVNVSPRQLHDLHFAKMVDEILVEHGLDPSLLTLEITESALLEGDDSVLLLLRTLQERGITLALDDFGTGYSSLSYLHQFPLGTLKIDRAFVRDMDKGNGMALLDTIVSMGRNLGLLGIAEGIELPSHVSELERLGCKYGQGFLFAHPLPADALEALLGQSLEIPGSSASMTKVSDAVLGHNGTGDVPSGPPHQSDDPEWRLLPLLPK